MVNNYEHHQNKRKKQKKQKRKSMEKLYDKKGVMLVTLNHLQGLFNLIFFINEMINNNCETMKFKLWTMT